jgi:hypothetical protein
MTVAPPNSGGDRSAVDQLNEEGQRTWWCLYAFEKILAFDLCRLSRILDSTLSTFKTWSVPRRDQNERLCSAQDCGNGKLADYKEALVSLVNLLSEIQDRSLHSWGQKELADLSIDDAVATIIQSVGEIETMVQSWQDRLPTEYKYVYSHNPNLDNKNAKC